MKIIGGQVFDLEQGFVEKELCANGALISAVSGDEAVVDASGCYVIPGLVDVHFHGCVGEDFSDASAEGLRAIADYQLSQGVAYICPAGMTLSEEQLAAVCATAAAHRKSGATGAEVVGAHLEGPFLSMAKKGAQNGDYLHDPDIGMFNRLQTAAEGCVKLISIAPELPGAMEFIEEASKTVTVSLAHTAANYDIATEAFQKGARHVTHMFNAMPPFSHRAPGVVGAAADDKNVRVEIISDGIHLHGAVVRSVFTLFGKERVVLISDSMRATGLSDGQYTLGGQDVTVKGKLATLADGTIAGSATNLMGCLRQAIAFGIPAADAVRAASYNPACAIGIEDRVGTLDEGKEASFVLLDREDLSIRAVVFKGAKI